MNIILKWSSVALLICAGRYSVHEAWGAFFACGILGIILNCAKVTVKK